MAILKHLSSKNSNYERALEYLIYQHDEITQKPILNDRACMIPREEFYLDGLNCNPATFSKECELLNQAFHKNQTRNEIKSHHYIISFDPRDKTECGLTGQRAQAIGLEFAKRFFPGHQTLVCTHMDGHNSSGNIHVHIVINSLRKLDVEPQAFMERPCDSRAGFKHHQTREYLTAMQKGLMEITAREQLHQIDLLQPAPVKITEREYWKNRREQEKLEKRNTRIVADGMKPRFTKFQTELQFIRDAVTEISAEAASVEELKNGLREKYGITLKESRGRFSYLPAGRERYITARRLGTDFEKDHLLALLQKNAKRYRYDPGYDYESDPIAILYVRSELRLVVDLQTCVKAQMSRAYEQKVKLSNLKEMAKTLCFVQEHGFDSLEQLAARRNELDAQYSQAKETLSDMEQEINTLNDQIYHVGLYYTNKETKKAYLAAWNKKKYQQEHLQALKDYQEGVRYIKDHFDASVPSLKGLKAQRDQMKEKRDIQRQNCSALKASLKELEIAQKNIDAILGRDSPAMEQEMPALKLGKAAPPPVGKASVLGRLHDAQQIVDTQEQQKKAERKKNHSMER